MAFPHVFDMQFNYNFLLYFFFDLDQGENIDLRFRLIFRQLQYFWLSQLQCQYPGAKAHLRHHARILFHLEQNSTSGLRQVFGLQHVRARLSRAPMPGNAGCISVTRHAMQRSNALPATPAAQPHATFCSNGTKFDGSLCADLSEANVLPHAPLCWTCAHEVHNKALSEPRVRRQTHGSDE